MSETQPATSPWIDTTTEIPTVKSDGTGCRHSSVDGGECPKMGLSFDSYEEWKKHRAAHHPISCGHCNQIASYIKQTGERMTAPHGRCVDHMPDPANVELAFAWKRTNTESVLEPPRLPEDHPVEQALSGGSQ